MLGALIAFAAAEQPTCEKLGSERFRTLVVDSQSAVDRGDLPLLKTVLSEIERDVPCLDFAPPPRQWADLMMVWAIAAYAEGEDWRSPLAAALRIRPGIDRGVGRSHPIYDWTPPDPRPGGPYEGEAVLYVDGRQSDYRPPSTGWYLVQKTDGEFWNSDWQRDTPVSTAWMNERVERPPELFWQLALGLQAGGSHVAQHTEALTDDVWRPYGSRYYDIALPYRPGGADFVRPGWGTLLKARVTFQHLGVDVGASVFWNRAPGLREGRISAIYDTRSWMAGAGLSLSDIFLQVLPEPSARRPDGSELPAGFVASSETHFERFYHLVGAVRSRGAIHGEATALFGVHSPHAYNGLFDFTMTFDGLEILGARPQIGGQAGFAMGRFYWVDGDRLRLDSVVFRTSTHLTLVFGKDYR